MKDRPILITGGIVYDGLGGEGVPADLLLRGGEIEAVIDRTGEGNGGRRSTSGTNPRAPEVKGPDATEHNATTIDRARREPPRGDVLPAPLAVAGSSSSARSSSDARRIDATRIDATGLAVCPGFIDLHSHSDLILTLPPEQRRTLQRGKLLQGITTEIAGNCGLAPAPVMESSRAAVRSVLSWMTPGGTDWEWDGFASYLERIEATPLPLNAGFLAAHGPIRAAVLGMGAVRAGGPALDRMQGFVADAMAAGAFGLSTGLIYPPGMHADTDELAALALPVARSEGIFTSHVRGSSETLLPAVGELLEIGRRAGCAVHHSHSEAVGPDHWHKIVAVLEMEAAARDAGIRATFDLFPYHAAATMMVAIYPPWALEGGPSRLLERLSDSTERGRIRRAVETQVPTWPPWTEEGWPHNLVIACGYERIFIARTGGRTKGRYDGMSLAELGRACGTDAFDAISDLMIEEEADVGQLIFGITGEDGADEAMVALLRSPFGAIATDACDYGTGLPHPAAYGTFPRILARFVRERGILTLPEAIRRMTSHPASILGLAGRGRIASGCAADIVVLDPASIADRATFSEPRREATGIRHVLVNGAAVVRDGKVTDVDAGRVLRRR